MIFDKNYEFLIKNIIFGLKINFSELYENSDGINGKYGRLFVQPTACGDLGGVAAQYVGRALLSVQARDRPCPRDTDEIIGSRSRKIPNLTSRLPSPPQTSPLAIVSTIFKYL